MVLIVGTIVGGIGSVVPIYFVIYGEQHVIVSLRHAPILGLTNMGSPNSSDMRVLFRGVDIKTPYLVSFTTENSGNIPIERQCVMEPLGFELVGDTAPRASIADLNPTWIYAAVR